MDKHEAAKLVGKSVKTIERWERNGVRIYDEVSLREHSALQDARSRGKSRNLISQRINEELPDVQSDPRSYFPRNLDPGAFVDLPVPFSLSQAENAVDAIVALRNAFRDRLRELKSIGHKLSTELAESDLAAIGVVSAI